jgi:uncharacterized protein
MAEILGKFLFGYYILRKNILSPSNINIDLIKKIWVITLVAGLLYVSEQAVLFFYDPELNKKIEISVYSFERIGILSLSLFYAASITLLYYKGKATSLFNAFQFIGMMSLTNYLTQTLFYVMIYYGIGLGLMGKLHLQWTLPIAIVIYSIQIIFSKLWLKKMRYGPVEWIWRQATYGKRLPLKK